MKQLSRIFLILTILWMIVIFVFSAQSGETSANLSGGISEFITSIIYSNFDNLSIDKQLELIDNVHFLVRKTAHFTEYAILGFLSLMTILTHNYSANNILLHFKMKLINSGIIALIFSSLYAASDEIHQIFAENRGPSVRDVLIDSCGALTGIIIGISIFHLLAIRLLQNKPTQEN